MIEDKIDAYCIQETWQLGNYEMTILVNTVFHHNITRRRNKNNRVHIMGGISIILSPRFTQPWKYGNPTPRTIETEKFEGRHISIDIEFKKYDSYGKRIKGWDRIRIVRIYLSYNEEEQGRFKGP